MKVYKLTDQSLQTYGWYQWTPGEWRETDGSGDLCGPGWLHFYWSPELAAFLNLIHASIGYPILWEAEADGSTKNDYHLKGGATRLRILNQIPLPVVTARAYVRLALMCTAGATTSDEYRKWARARLAGDLQALSPHVKTVLSLAERMAYEAEMNYRYNLQRGYDTITPGIRRDALCAIESSCQYNFRMSVNLPEFARKAME